MKFFVPPILVALAVLSTCAAGQSVSPEATPDVVIVGAGVSGLRAAEVLECAGASVVVLEGRERVGGRVHSVPFGAAGATADMGASWIHGVSGNPLSSFSAEKGISTLETPYDGHTFAYKDGAEESDTDALLEDVYSLVADVSAERGVSMYDAMTALLRDRGDSWSRERNATAAFGVLASFALSLEDLDSTQNTDPDERDFPGADAIFPGAGFAQIPKALYDALSGPVRLGETVTEIAADSGGGTVTVQASKSGAVSAKRAIVTVPLGVLKAGSIRFDPPLSASKSGAISRLGMGLLAKLHLRFGTGWDSSEWSEVTEPEYLLLVGKNRGDVAFAMLVPGAAGAPPKILVLVGGRAGWDLERDPQRFRDEAMAALRTVFPEIPDPEEYLVSSWGQDPFSRGSYSALAVGADYADRDLLAEAEGNVHFAGEATYRKSPSSVHAAWISGERAASEVAKELGLDTDACVREHNFSAAAQRTAPVFLALFLVLAAVVPMMI